MVPDDGSEDVTAESAEPRSISITLTEPATERLQGAIDGHGGPVAGIRLAIAGRGPEGFQHSLSLIEAGEPAESDQVVESGGITFLVENREAEYLDGVVIDYDGETGGGMIKFENPNPLWSDQLSSKIQELMDTQLNPQIASHGGTVSLHGVEGATAYIELGGGCVGCGMVDVTLKQGIEVAIKDTVPEIEEVVDVTDHGSGTNPYYKPAKK